MTHNAFPVTTPPSSRFGPQKLCLAPKRTVLSMRSLYGAPMPLRWDDSNRAQVTNDSIRRSLFFNYSPAQGERGREGVNRVDLLLFRVDRILEARVVCSECLLFCCPLEPPGLVCLLIPGPALDGDNLPSQRMSIYPPHVLARLPDQRCSH